VTFSDADDPTSASCDAGYRRPADATECEGAGNAAVGDYAATDFKDWALSGAWSRIGLTGCIVVRTSLGENHYYWYDNANDPPIRSNADWRLVCIDENSLCASPGGRQLFNAEDKYAPSPPSSPSPRPWQAYANVKASVLTTDEIERALDVALS
jgi:hypothetical protein